MRRVLVVVVVVVLALFVLADDARGCSDGRPAPGCSTTTPATTTSTSTSTTVRSTTTRLLPYDKPVPTVTRAPVVVVMDTPQVIADVARAIPAAPSFTG